MKYFILILSLSLLVFDSEIRAASTHEGFFSRENDQFSRGFPRPRTEVTIYKVVCRSSTNFIPETENPAALLHRLADEITQEKEEILPLNRVKFSNITNLQDIACEIKRSFLSDKSCEVDFSSSGVHDDWIEIFVEMMLSREMRRYVQNIECLNLNNNFIGIYGLQSLIPLLKLNTLKIVDISNTGIDEEQLEIFGSSEAYNQYTPENYRIILSSQDRETLLKKLIWIPKSFFDDQDIKKNPAGIFVTDEVIFRHRKYYKLAY